MPITGHAEILTYNVCKNGCEYSELNDVFYLLENKSMNEGFTEDDSVIINIMDSETYSLVRQPNFDNSYDYYAINYNITSTSYNTSDRIYMKEFVIKSDYMPTIDANKFWVLATTVSVKNVNFNNTIISGGSDYQEFINVKGLEGARGAISTVVEDCEDIRITPAYYEPPEINVKNSKNIVIAAVGNGVNATIVDTEGVRISGAGTFHVDNCKNVIFGLGFGNADIDNSQLEPFMNFGINLEITNSTVGKILNYAAFADSTINIYNSKIAGDKYYKVHSEEELTGLGGTNFSAGDANTWPWDYLDVSEGHESNTFIHFDKTKEIKVGEKINILEEFEYLNSNKDINYSIKNEQIAKIQNNELTALSSGSTEIVATTDEGHFIFTIHLTVSDTLVSKEIEIPITGIKIKLWVLVIAVLLVIAVSVCAYVLLKNKKAE